MTPTLTLATVEKRFGRRTVLSGVSLALAPGRACTVRGANGSGKSTLLRLAAGLARPSGGVVERVGTVAYVPAAVAMPRRTSLRHLLGGLSAMTGGSAPLDAALETLGCAEYLDRPADTLSTGTALKALIAQALCSQAALVVLDEPAAHLDDDAAGGLARLVAAACAGGRSVLMAGAGGAAVGTEVVELVSGRLYVRGTA